MLGEGSRGVPRCGDTQPWELLLHLHGSAAHPGLPVCSGREQRGGAEGRGRREARCLPIRAPWTLWRSPPRSRPLCPHLEQIRSIQLGPALGGHPKPAHPRGPSHSLTTCRSDSPRDARPCSVLASRWPLDLFSMKADRFRTYIPVLSGLSLQLAMISPEACLFIYLFIYPGR